MHHFLNILGLFLLCAISYVLFRGFSMRRLPPGPAGLPLIGMLLNMPKESEWKTFKQWCNDLATDIIHIPIARKSIIIIDKYETAIELLNKRSSIYSSRPSIPMMELMGNWQDFNVPFMPYGDAWRTRRRLFHQIVREQTNHRFLPLIQNGVNQMLLKLLDNPQDFLSHIHFMAASIIIQISYGLEIKTRKDPHYVLLERAAHELIRACQPEVFYVNAIPALKYVPKWFPGAHFKRYADEWTERTKLVVQGTYQAAKDKILKGDCTPSFVFDTFQSIGGPEKLTKQDESEIMSVALSMYGAGSDTTAASLSTFILILTLNPKVQKEAQEELSRRNRPGHLPSFEERDSFPYITAVVYELVRWASTVPTGVPHVLDADDVYESYHIPAGSIVMANIWSMQHDETMYPSPEEFDPYRFLKNGVINQEVRNPLDVSFGFGRRVCPGRFLAFSSLWTGVASILATLDIKKLDGHDDPPIEFRPAIVLHPIPFKCSIKPRSSEAEALIRSLNVYD